MSRIIKKILSGLLLLIVLNSNAQINSRIKFNMGIDNHLPVSTFKNVYSYGLGLSPMAEYKLFNHLSIDFSPAGVIYFYKLKSVGVSGSTGFITVMAGPKIFLTDQFYILGNGGAGFKLSKFGNESAIAIAGGGGVILKKRFDFQLKYQKISTSTLAPQIIGVRLGYIFK